VANVTYKHLEGKTVVGLLSLGQWVQLLAGVVVGLLFGIYLSPLPPTPTIFISCLLPGLPLAASYGAMGLEFSLSQGARAAWRFWRRPRRHLPGAGQSATGYLVRPDPDARPPAATADGDAAAGRDLEALWDA
jgi:tellurite resistance protein TehA-like permease